MENLDSNFNNKILDKADVIARTVISQQDFYFSENCNENHKQLLETMIGAAIWCYSVARTCGQVIYLLMLKKLLNLINLEITLTKDHHYPRKLQQQTFKFDWSTFLSPAEEVLQRYQKYMDVIILFCRE